MKIIARLVAVLSIVLLTAVLHAPDASAARIQTVSGRSGAVWTNGPMLTGYDHRVRLANGYYMTTRTWEAGSYTVGRSGSYAGTQDIVGVQMIQRYINGQWTTWTQRELSGRASGSGTVTFPRWAWYPANQPQNRFAYRTVFVIGWYIAGTTRELGAAVVFPNSTSDNRCVIAFNTPCNVYWDGIVF